MTVISLIAAAVMSYLLGSLNSSIIVVRVLKHEDIREHGSKNAGLTNTLRCFGKVPALLTLLGDIAKGVAAVFLSQLLVHLLAGDAVDSRLVGYIAGIFVMLGHVFPLYYGFKGGKGALVTAAVLLCVDPISFAIVIPLFIIIVALTRYVSLGSVIGAVAYAVSTFFINHFVRHTQMDITVMYTVCAALSALVIIIMHRSNIKRLLNGTENKFGSKEKKE